MLYHKDTLKRKKTIQIKKSAFIAKKSILNRVFLLKKIQFCREKSMVNLGINEKGDKNVFFISFLQCE